jgi:single-stranded DNA-specific DHH superfamily exonuclease
VPGFLKLVAIGTVADVAKLIGENRTIVALGPKDLASARNPGRALMEIAGCHDGTGMRAMTGLDRPRSTPRKDGRRKSSRGTV